MGFSVSTSFAVVFLATLIATGALYAAGGNVTERLVASGQAELDHENDRLRTDLTIERATYYALDGLLSIRVGNAGATTLSVSGTDVLVDGRLRRSFEVRRVTANPATDEWYPGETLHLVLRLDDPERLQVVTGNGLARFTSLRPYSYVSGSWPTFGYDPRNAGAATATVPATPAVRWAHATGGPVASSPAVVVDSVYVGSDDGSLYALDATTGRVIWRTALGDPIRSSPTVAGDTVYVGTDGGAVVAIDRGNGSVEWTSTAPGDAVRSSPTVLNGSVYVGSDDQSLYALHAANGSVRWTYPTAGQPTGGLFPTFGGAVGTTPAVADGTVYVGTDGGAVHAVHAANGSNRWANQLNLVGEVRSSPAVANGRVFVGAITAGGTGSLYALDAATGAEQWSDGTIQPESSPAVHGGTVFVADDGGTVSALFAPNGTLRWSATPGGGIASSPAVAGGALVVGSDDGNLYALNESDGATRWSVTTGGAVTSSPAVAGRVVYVGSDDDSLYAVAPG